MLAKGASEYIPKLYNLVIIKDHIAKLIWYLLTGSMVISTSLNAILGIKCSRSAANLTKMQKEFSEKESKVVVNKPKTFAVTD